jgi:hypothetical protein
MWAARGLKPGRDVSIVAQPGLRFELPLRSPSEPKGKPEGGTGTRGKPSLRGPGAHKRVAPVARVEPRGHLIRIPAIRRPDATTVSARHADDDAYEPKYRACHPSTPKADAAVIMLYRCRSVR